MSAKDQGWHFYNTAYLMDSAGEIVDRYDKIHLVLFSEWIPLKHTLKFLRVLVPGDFGTLQPGARNVVFQTGGRKFGVAICYEDTYARRMRAIKNAGADFALNITNDAWFRASEELEQHLAISVFRAVESRIGVFRCGNTGLTGVVDPTGRIVSTAPRDEEATFAARVRWCSTPSVYARRGDLFAWACILAGLGGILGLRKGWAKASS